jgi:hypothetical protein
LDHLQKVQAAYTEGFIAMAQLVGNNTIISGMQVTGGNITDGYVVINGEVLRFVGGSLSSHIAIVEQPTAVVFDDNSSHDVEFVRYATSALTGVVAYSDLVRLENLRNIWLPGDIKEKYVDAAYEAANFDVNGFGINRELGWRKLSSVVPTAAGKVFVNKDDADSDFDTVGKTGGAKTVTLSVAQMPSHSHSVALNAASDSGGGSITSGGATGNDGNVGTSSQGNGDAHENMPPYFVILKLVKL